MIKLLFKVNEVNPAVTAEEANADAAADSAVGALLVDSLVLGDDGNVAVVDSIVLVSEVD